jgi:DNA-binding CsgD family transcriptional regulator
LLSLGDGRLEFCHPLARSAIYGGAEVDRRRAVHRALADALPDSDADRRAWHLALAALGPDEAASSALAQAASRARERSAYEVASSAFERAALLAAHGERRADLLFGAADTAWLGGQPERALTLLDETERADGSTPLAHRVARLRGEIVLRRGPLHEGRLALVAAAERAAGERPDDAVAMLAEAALGAFYEADAAAVRACGERAAELAAGRTDERTRFLAQLTEGMALILGGEGERGAAAIRAGMATIERLGELADARLLVWAALGPLWLREAETGRELVDRASAAARAESAVGVLPHLLGYVSLAHVASDRWAEAQAGFDEAVRLARETGQRVVLAAALARLAWLEARLGREASCRAHVAEALAVSRELDVALCEIWSLLALGELELVLGNAVEAVAALEEGRASVARCGVDDVDLQPAPELVELQLRLGRPGAAAALAEEYAVAAAVKGQPWALARAARTRGLVSHDDAFAACFDEALDFHDRTPDVFERARTLLAYGERLRRAGRRSEARERLRAALEVFEELGAAAWAERVRTELAATGETARRRESASLDELTPQELQISLLLAEGKTTREAAAALFLSPKTIEYHLRNAYRKLAIHSRDELREVLTGKVGVTGSSPTERGPR